ncbi:hypothetical protein [Sphingobacterium mizutaii]|uniref:hypothetical protein n=1 Tax=Sphingobacterium mizutaii TaxID=1010 RepID=UPI0011BEE7E8|nr:hypothetical protein [Sphingobacterium mizutaii]
MLCGLNQDVRDGRMDQDRGMNQDWVRLPFDAAQGTAHPARMGGWTKIIVNLSLERAQYCRGESHSPAFYRMILNQDVRDGRMDQDRGINQDWVRLPFDAAQGTAHPPRMGG